MNKPIYKTLGELKAAYESGELHPDWGIVIDNDYVSVYAPDVDAQRRLSYAECQTKYPDMDTTLVWEFDGSPRHLLGVVLTQLGFPVGE